MISTYLDNSNPSADVMSHTLYVVWAGGNDYFAGADPSKETVPNLISSIKSILDHSVDGQKRYIIVPNLPDLGKIPYADTPEKQQALTAVATAHNKLLAEQLSSEIMSNPQYKDRAVIIPVDIATLFANISSKPADYGFTNTTKACYDGSYMPDDKPHTVCAEEKTSVFWDGVHPTTKAHCNITKAALLSLKAANLLAKPEVADNYKCD
jgi:thermolabile hemolysin